MKCTISLLYRTHGIGSSSAQVISSTLCTRTGRRMSREYVLSCACVPSFIVGYQKRALAVEWNEIPLCSNTRKCYPPFFHRPICPYVCGVCYTATYLCPAWIIVIETNRTTLRIGRNSIKGSFLSFLLKGRRMSRWYFISVENDSEMILRSCLPVSSAMFRLNWVKMTAISILYSPRILASFRSRNLVHDPMSTTDAKETYMKIYRFV